MYEYVYIDLSLAQQSCISIVSLYICTLMRPSIPFTVKGYDLKVHVTHMLYCYQISEKFLFTFSDNPKV